MTVFLNPDLHFFFPDEAWFCLSGYISSQNSRHWNINLRQILEVPLHDQKTGVVCHYC
jgi:hypothetical protein